MKTHLFIIFAAAGLFSSCIDGGANESSRPGNERKISKYDYGQAWPFTVNEGVLKCEDNAVIFIADGRTYGVNGLAKSRGRSKGYSDIEDIWALDPLISEGGKTDVRINIGQVLSDGLKLCK